MRRILIVLVAIPLLAAGAARPRSVLDLKTAPGARGRDNYAMLAIAAFAGVIAEAPVCGIRSHRWGGRLETYLGVVLDDPRRGIKEGVAAPGRYRAWMRRLHAAEARDDLLVAESARSACAAVRHDPGLAVGDWLAAKARARARSADPWAGAGGK